MQVGYLGAAARAAKALAKREYGEILSVALNEARDEENASVFAAPAHGDKRHPRSGQLAERASSLPHLRFRLLIDYLRGE
jgi:hypothetical protein